MLYEHYKEDFQLDKDGNQVTNANGTPYTATSITKIEDEMDIHGNSYQLNFLDDGEAGLAQIREGIRSDYEIASENL